MTHLQTAENINVESLSDMESEAYHSMMGSLAPIDFDVRLEPLFRKTGDKLIEVPEAKAITRKEGVVSVVSNKYKLLPYRETLLPAVERAFANGWRLAERKSGRSAVRIESNGRRAFVEMTHPEIEMTLPGAKQMGKPEVLIPRAVISNSYDCTTRLHTYLDVFIKWCANGAIRPMFGGAKMVEFTGRRHVGMSDDQTDRFVEVVAEYSEHFGDYIKAYAQLVESVPGEEKAIKAIEKVSTRHRDAIVERVESDYLNDATGWQVFNGITNYLTHDFRGSHRLFNQKQNKALAELLA